MTLGIRHVVSADALELRALRMRALASDPDAFGSTYELDDARPPEWWSAWAADSEAGTRQRTFVVADAASGELLGLALVRLTGAATAQADDEVHSAVDDDSAHRAEVLAMWVAPEIRGQGWSVALCNVCAEWAASQGAAHLDIAVVDGNIAAQGAYEAAGFRVTGRGTWSEAGRTLEELLMVRPLSAKR